MDLDLTDTEVRVLGALVEKERTTPDQYPLSTNAPVSACNQKTSRDPVMSVTEVHVDAAMLSIRERGFARSLRPSGSRAWKHRHVLPEALAVGEGAIAVLGVLMLRGPQTPGELRTRTDRMHGFEDVAAVEAALQELADHEPRLVRNLGRGPGQSQDRWVHLLSDDAPTSPASSSSEPAMEPPTSPTPPPTQRADESELLILRRELRELEQRFDKLVDELGVDM